MKILLNVYRSNEDADGFDCAIVNLTPTLARKVLDRAEMFETVHDKDTQLLDIEFWDCSVSFICGAPDGLEDVLGSGEDYAEVEVADDKVEPLIDRTECDRMVLRRGEVYWSAVPKHADWHVETRPIPLELVRKVVAAAEVTA